MAVGGQAELIYVKGPQAGQRASLMSAVVTVGRGQQADVQLTEEHVSRKHFQLTLTQDGWVFENLSPLRSRVGGKKYKIGKKLILDTGDVISVGAETELLFVATGDDPEAALIAYRQRAGKKGKARSAAGAAAPVAPAVPTEAKPAGDGEPDPLAQIEGSAAAAAEPEEEEAELDEEELAALAQKAKLKKYLTIFGVYIGVLAVIAVIFASMIGPSGPRHVEGGMPVLLSDAKIDEFLNVPLNRDKNSVEAKNALREALLELEKTNRADHLYQAIYQFKLSRAYGKVFSTRDEKLFVDAKTRLTKRVQEMYRNAYAYEKDRQYITSERIFRDILDMVPSLGRRDEKSELRNNIVAHLNYIKKMDSKTRKR